MSTVDAEKMLRTAVKTVTEVTVTEATVTEATTSFHAVCLICRSEKYFCSGL